MILWMCFLDLSIANSPRAIYECIILSGFSEKGRGIQDVHILYVERFYDSALVVDDVPAFAVDDCWHRTGQMFHGSVFVVKYG